MSALSHDRFLAGRFDVGMPAGVYGLKQSAGSRFFIMIPHLYSGVRIASGEGVFAAHR